MKDDLQSTFPIAQEILLHQVKATPLSASACRVEFSNSIPCFHCSKSLQQLSRAKGAGRGQYVGFVLQVDGIDRVFHLSCIDHFEQGICPDCLCKQEVCCCETA